MSKWNFFSDERLPNFKDNLVKLGFLYPCQLYLIAYYYNHGCKYHQNYQVNEIFNTSIYHVMSDLAYQPYNQIFHKMASPYYLCQSSTY